MRIDLHVHTEASHDCRTPIQAFPAWCLAHNLRVLAVTDHDQHWGGVALQQHVRDLGLDDQLWIIAGEEITTREGELIGLFLQERIPPNLTPEDTVREIKAQGGLVMLQHGFDPLKRYRLRPEATARIADDVDIVETFNARLSRPQYNRDAATWAQARHLPECGGSDAHTLQDVGEGWSEAPLQPVRTPEELLAALRAGQVHGSWTPPVWAFVRKQWRNLWSSASGRGRQTPE
nr:PHP domain-containing protein [Deinococcus maricopensis]